LADDQVSQFLGPQAQSLFEAMPPYDRRHALSVMHTLQLRGHTSPDLFAAALLHDMGKTVQWDGTQAVRGDGALRLWHRVAVVLMRALSPELVARIGEDRPGSWRRPFFVQQRHAAIGAELARQAGCSARTVELISHHEDPPDQTRDPLLAALQAADGMN
jgi:predicted HD phosphohydrolase